MSREIQSTKKRRLESEMSQASGITNLSNVTQTTDLSSDFDDNNSDSSSTNLNNTCHGSRSTVFTDGQTQVLNAHERPAKKAIRKRQVSWSIDDDETFVKEIPQRQIAPYDNNFNGTNNSRRRTRRATESSIDNHELSYFKPLSSVNGNCDSCNHQLGAPPLRSNTTSQIHGHEHDIQKQRLIDELVRQYDASKLQQRRSQSVSSLRTDSHMYESLQHQRPPAQVIINHPVDTVVTMPNPDKDYLHPTTETKVHRNMKHDSFTTLNNFSGLSDESSAYADVIRYKSNESSKGNQHQVLCFNDCNNSFYRKGFYLLLVFNVIIVILNSFGLPFVYSAIKQEKENESHGGIIEAQRSQICLKCDMLFKFSKQELESSKVTVTKDKECCFKSAEQLLPSILRTVAYSLQAGGNTSTVPVVQLKADKKNDNTQKTVVIWQPRADINTVPGEAKIVDNKFLRIPNNATGYYYVYSRVHYEKPKGNDTNSHNEFTIGHTVMKKTSGNGQDEPIDKIVQRCFPSNSNGDVRHTNHLGSVQHLRGGEELYVKLDHKQYFDYTNTIFGVFQVAK